ncbi:DUF1404 domain-containing protein [Acidianus sulfidivorans JP7]|uniref:DUF1404 family protein n=1 Tax=Acidianus sulfidivorans TaxID=312539 RepID=UPI0014438972|nr:DUF1404 family protein [Acidianus sulfidivorans]AWR96613.2 DUF1404 domain-containing protein [Acidianus sulfidivorans JP7]
MNNFLLAKYLSFILLGISIIIYVMGDTLYRLLSFQGPLFAGALLGWYTINSSTPKDKFVEFEDTMIPVVSLLIRKRSWIGFLVTIALIVPWLTPPVFRLGLIYPELYILAFVCDFIGGFIAGYFVSSLKFMEKIILYSLGFAADIFYIMLLYIYSLLYNISQTSLLDHILVYVYSVKFLEAIIFAMYIIRKVNAI